MLPTALFALNPSTTTTAVHVQMVFATLHICALTQHLFCLLDYQVITTPLPSGGPELVSILNILEGFNFTEKDQDKSLIYHYMIEVY